MGINPRSQFRSIRNVTLIFPKFKIDSCLSPYSAMWIASLEGLSNLLIAFRCGGRMRGIYVINICCHAGLRDLQTCLSMKVTQVPFTLDLHKSIWHFYDLSLRDTSKSSEEEGPFPIGPRSSCELPPQPVFPWILPNFKS